MKIFRFLLPICSAVLLSQFNISCAPAIKRISPPIPIEKIFIHLEQNVRSLENFEAIGTIYVESPSFSNSADFRLAIKKRDSLSINITGPFGLAIASGLATKDQLIYINELTSQVLFAKPSKKNIKKVFRVDLSFEELLDILTGNVLIDTHQISKQQVRVEEDQYLITNEKDQFIHKYWIDIRELAVSKYHIYNRRGNLLLDLRFNNFTQQKGIVYPQFIYFESAERNEKIKVSYSKVKVNEPNLDLNIYIPEDAEIITWQE